MTPMRDYLSLFVGPLKQATTLAVVMALLVPDPLWASGVCRGLPSVAISPAHQAAFLEEVFIPPVSVTRWLGRATVQNLAIFSLIVSVLPVPLIAEQKTEKKSEKKPQRPPVERLQVPEEPTVAQQNIQLTEAQWKNIWHTFAHPARAASIEGLSREVIVGNSKLSEMFFKHRAAWQSLIAIRHDEGRSHAFGFDRFRAPGVPFTGTGPTIDQAIGFPDVTVAHPKQQTLNPSPDEEKPGKKFWKGWIDGLMNALRGKQWVSRNQVDAEFLREKGQAFEVRKAYADLEQTALMQYEDALRSALAFQTQSAHLDELRETVRNLEKLLEREKAAAGFEGKGPNEIFRLQNTLLEALNTLLTAENALEKTRVHWLSTFSPSAQALVDVSQSALRPAALTAVDLPGDVPADLTLAASPLQRRLELQQELLESVEKQLLELKKEPTWRAGYHFALGLPFAALLNFDRQSPDAAAQRNVDEWITKISLQQREIDSQINQEEKRVREAFLMARSEYQNARVQLTATQILIAQYEKQLQAARQANTRYVAADSLRPGLEIRRLEKVLERYRQEAYAAAQLMQVHTVELQAKLMQDVATHYQEVTRQIDSAAAKPIARVIRWVFPAVLTILATLLPALASAHTFVPRAATLIGAAVQPLYAGNVISAGVQRVALDVTLGRYRSGSSANTLTGIAGDILSAVHAQDQGHFTQGELISLMKQIAADNHLKSIHDVAAGSTLNVGSYDPSVVERLAEHFTPHVTNSVSSVASLHDVASLTPEPIPMSVATPTLDTLQAVLMPPAPTSFPIQVDHTSFLTTVQETFYQIVSWVQDPWHIAGMVAVVVGTTVLTTMFVREQSNRPAFNPYPAFITGPSRTERRLQGLRSRLPLFSFIGVFSGLWVQSAVMPLIPWLMPTAAVLLAAYALGRSPKLRRHPVVRAIYPISVAAWVAWLLPIHASNVVLPVFGLTWTMFQLFVSANSSQPLNVIYRWGRNRRWAPVGALLAFLVFAPALYIHAVQPVRQWVTQRYELLTRVNTFGTNFGVSVQPVRMPVTWGAPEGGVVTAVRSQTSTVRKGEWVIAYEPMERALWGRLQRLAQTLAQQPDFAQVDAARLRKAAVTHPKALIQVRADYEQSVDKEISDALDHLEELLQNLRVEGAAYEQRAAAGVTTRSFEESRLKDELRSTVNFVNAKLLERDGRHLRAARSFQTLQGSGWISAGTEIKRASPTDLFTQELTNHRFLQVRLTPADVLALERAWSQTPEKTTLRLISQDDQQISLSLQQIEEVVRGDDVFWATAQENFSGLQITHPVVGVDPIQTVNLVVRVDADSLWAKAQGPYQFQGVFQGEQRLAEEPHGLIFGNLSLVPDVATHVQHFAFRLSPRREQLVAIQKLIQSYERLLERVMEFQQANTDRPWAPQAATDYRTRLENLRSEAARITSDIELIERSGVVPSRPSTQPIQPFSFAQYPLERAHAAAAHQEALWTMGSRVRVRVVFHDEASELETGDRVHVRTPRAQAEFKIIGESSLDARYGLYRYEAEAVMSPEEERRFFPAGQPMTETFVEVERPAATRVSSVQTTVPQSAGLFAGLPALWVSFVRRRKRETMRTTSLDASVFDWPHRHGFAPPRLKSPAAFTPRPLDENQLHDLLDRLRNTTLERERYWYNGDPTTYLSTWQFLTHRFRNKIKLKERRVLLRRYQRDDLTRWTAWLLDRAYYLRTQRDRAGSKTTTILWVWPWLGMVLAAYFFGNNDLALEVSRFFTANQTIMTIANHRVISTAVAAFIAYWVVGFAVTAGKGVGELLATTPYNATGLFMLFLRNVFRYDVEDRYIREKIRLQKIYDTRILREGSQEHEDFIKDLNTFALQIAERAYARLSRDKYDQPSEESIAFENAFRIQIRRSQIHPSILFKEKFPIELKPVTWHFESLRRQDVDVNRPENDRELLLQHARIQEAKDLMRQYPLHTLMALFRAGTTELTADIEHMDDRGLVRQNLAEVKDRTHTFDDDVFDGIRAQERFEDLFDLLHYIFEGLRDGVMGHAPLAVLKDIEAFLDPAVVPEERLTWIQFWKDLPGLMERRDKTLDQQSSDEGLVRMIVYALALRRIKEDEKSARELMERLRRREQDYEEQHQTQSRVMEDRYLRDAKGQPTTSVLELNVAYLKYFDLMTQLAGRFPDAALLGDRNIYLTCENTVNFRQALREMDLWLRLTRGRVTLIDVGGSNRSFADSIDDYVPSRISGNNADRVSVSTLDGVRDALAKDTQAIIFSSATPLDWMILVQSAGELYHVPSELLSPASAIVAVRDIGGDRLDSLALEYGKALQGRYLSLEEIRRPLAEELEKGWPEYNEAGYRFMKVFRLKVSVGGLIREAKSYLPYKRAGRRLQNIHRRVQQITAEQDQLLKQMDDLRELQREVFSVGHYLERLGIETREIHEGSLEKLPIVDDRQPLKGQWVVNVLFRLIRKAPFVPSTPETPSSTDRRMRAAA